MVAIITGDIIRSKKAKTALWMKVLKKELGKLGAFPKKWEIFRGDSFQAEIADPMNGLIIAIKLKAAIKSMKGIDVRIAIGIGKKKYSASRITESNGSAFIFSGEKFDKLKKEKQTLALRSEWGEFDREMNLYLKFLMVIINRWTENSAQTVAMALEKPGLSQAELGKRLGIKQNAVSTRLKRTSFEEIIELNELYKDKLRKLLK